VVSLAAGLLNRLLRLLLLLPRAAVDFGGLIRHYFDFACHIARFRLSSLMIAAAADATRLLTENWRSREQHGAAYAEMLRARERVDYDASPLIAADAVTPLRRCCHAAALLLLILLRAEREALLLPRAVRKSVECARYAACAGSRRALLRGY